jgi:predicted nucleic-acid-binding Zn-ribbon protein
MRETDGLLSKIMNVQKRYFVTVSCTQCGYTDLFERQPHATSTILDIMVR